MSDIDIAFSSIDKLIDEKTDIILNESREMVWAFAMGAREALLRLKNDIVIALESKD